MEWRLVQVVLVCAGEDGGPVGGELVHEVLQQVLGQPARRRHQALTVSVATKFTLLAFHALKKSYS